MSLLGAAGGSESLLSSHMGLRVCLEKELFAVARIISPLLSLPAPPLAKEPSLLLFFSGLRER